MYRGAWLVRTRALTKLRVGLPERVCASRRPGAAVCALLWNQKPVKLVSGNRQRVPASRIHNVCLDKPRIRTWNSSSLGRGNPECWLGWLVEKWTRSRVLSMHHATQRTQERSCTILVTCQDRSFGLKPLRAILDAQVPIAGGKSEVTPGGAELRPQRCGPDAFKGTNLSQQLG